MKFLKIKPLFDKITAKILLLVILFLFICHSVFYTYRHIVFKNRIENDIRFAELNIENAKLKLENKITKKEIDNVESELYTAKENIRRIRDYLNNLEFNIYWEY